MESKHYESLIQNAIAQIRQLKAQLKEKNKSKDESIAVLGMSCRLPGSNKVYDNSFWQFLLHAKKSISSIPQERWDVEKYYNPDQTKSGYTYSCKGSFFSDLRSFDSSFFGISPREALHIDPQHRFMMECAWEAIEDAGIPPRSLKGQNLGVFMAQCSDDYHQIINTLNRREQLDYYSGTGTSRSMIAGRLSYILGTHGPSIQVDTSCSSSLTALHLATQSIRAGECDIAVVGGVQMNISPMSSILRSRTQALSPDGECRAFDKNANGFVQGEGVGVLVISSQDYAASQQKRVYAFIKGTAMNHDGASAGLTAPSEIAQIKVIQSALSNSNVSSEDIDYIEAHGTGTVLGDPIEINALNSVYGKNRKDPIWIGSLKSNIGHLEAAAGIMSVIKAILALSHKTIPPHIYASNLNNHIDWGAIPFKVPQTATTWKTLNKPRYAAVSSFGMSGTNIHLILKENEETTDDLIQETYPLLFTLSAKTEDSLRELVVRYKDYLSSCQPALSSVCFTATTGRDHYKYRFCAIVTTLSELIEFLKEFLHKDMPKLSAPLVIDKEYSAPIALLNSIPGIQKYYSPEDKTPFELSCGSFIRSLVKSENSSFHVNTLSDDFLSNPYPLLYAIGKAYLEGRNINWNAYYEGSYLKPISLPPYAFRNKPLWPKGLEL